MKHLLLILGLMACDSHDHSHVQPGVSTGATCPPSNTVTYANFGKTFMTRYCVACHDSQKAGDARQGAPEFHDFDSVLGIKQVKEHVDQYAGAGPAATNTAMPPSEPIPTLDERKQLAEWLACGLPE